MSDKLSAGSPAPNFTLHNQNNELVSLSDFLGKKTIVLFFYPADNTPGCTAEACSFRDSYEDFTDAGAEVIGISGGTVENKQSFILKNRLPFTLLNDSDWSVAKAYGVGSSFMILRDRKTFVIDRTGIVRHVFSSMFNMAQHSQEALDIVKTLEKEVIS